MALKHRPFLATLRTVSRSRHPRGHGHCKARTRLVRVLGSFSISGKTSNFVKNVKVLILFSNCHAKPKLSCITWWLFLQWKQHPRSFKRAAKPFPRFTDMFICKSLSKSTQLWRAAAEVTNQEFIVSEVTRHPSVTIREQSFKPSYFPHVS